MIIKLSGECIPSGKHVPGTIGLFVLLKILPPVFVCVAWREWDFALQISQYKSAGYLF